MEDTKLTKNVGVVPNLITGQTMRNKQSWCSVKRAKQVSKLPAMGDWSAWCEDYGWHIKRIEEMKGMTQTQKIQEVCQTSKWIGMRQYVDTVHEPQCQTNEQKRWRNPCWAKNISRKSSTHVWAWRSVVWLPHQMWDLTWFALNGEGCWLCKYG
jgi:hypothetical protein